MGAREADAAAVEECRARREVRLRVARYIEQTADRDAIDRPRNAGDGEAGLAKSIDRRVGRCEHPADRLGWSAKQGAGRVEGKIKLSCRSRC